MKKILFVNDELTTGGVTTVLFHLLNALDKNEYDISLLVLDQRVMPGDIPKGVKVLDTSSFFDVCDLSFKTCKEMGFSYLLKKIRFYLLIKSGGMVNAIRGIRKKMDLEHYDIEIAYKEGISTLFILAGDADKKVNFVHSDYKVKNYSANYMTTMTKAFKEVDVNVAVSRVAKESFEEIFGLDNVTVIHNLLDVEKIKRMSRDEYEYAGEGPHFLAVGRLHPQKSYDRLLNVAKRLNDEGYRYDLMILGNGEEAEKLFKQKEDLGLKNVNFAGNQRNPFKYMKNADCLVLSSLYEGLPTVVSEALLCGLPVLSTEVAGIDELLKEEYGNVVENSEEGLYRGLKSILDDPAQLIEKREALKGYKDENEENLKKLKEVFS